MPKINRLTKFLYPKTEKDIRNITIKIYKYKKTQFFSLIR